MTPRERVLAAMRLQVPDQVPVMCQMATGHILLQTGVDPLADAAETETYARGLWEARKLYDFDGILIHKPGRCPGWLDQAEPADGGTPGELVFPDGGRIRIQRNDDPVYVPPPGFRWPEVEQIDPDNPFHGTFTGSHLAWHDFKGTHDFKRVEDVPSYWYDCIDTLIEWSQGRFSLHGETRAPFDHVVNLVSIENLMMALITDPDRVHRLMTWAAEAAIVWSVAQIRRGVDAIKISSPFVGSGFISLANYREFVAPYEAKLIDAIHDAGGIAYTHTCGSISDRLEDMLAGGTDGLECLDPPPLGNVDITDAVDRMRGKAFIKGNMDAVNTLLNKPIDVIRESTKKMVETAAPGGGYICSTACSISPAVPREHIQAMVDTAREFRY
jgi:hypothetical protein